MHSWLAHIISLLLLSAFYGVLASHRNAERNPASSRNLPARWNACSEARPRAQKAQSSAGGRGIALSARRSRYQFLAPEYINKSVTDTVLKIILVWIIFYSTIFHSFFVNESILQPLMKDWSDGCFERPATQVAR